MPDYDLSVPVTFVEFDLLRVDGSMPWLGHSQSVACYSRSSSLMAQILMI
jgi:hypothetical protein